MKRKKNLNGIDYFAKDCMKIKLDLQMMLMKRGNTILIHILKYKHTPRTGVLTCVAMKKILLKQ